MTGRAVVAAASMLLVTCAACERPASPSVARSPSHAAAPSLAPAPALPSVPPPSAAEAAADPRAAFARYLAFTVFQGAPAGADSLAACDTSGESQEGWEPDDYIGLMNPVMLGVTRDTGAAAARSASGVASVLVVAHFQRDSVNWVGSLQRQADTLRFTILRGAAGWSVCGPAAQARDSVPYSAYFPLTLADARRTEVNSARWTPAGTTWENVGYRANSLAHRPGP